MCIKNLLLGLFLFIGFGTTTLSANTASTSLDKAVVDCDITISVDDATSTVSILGLDAAHVKLKIYDESWSQIDGCFDDCGDPAVFSGLAPGIYNLTVLLMDDSWSEICESSESFEIVTPPCIDNDEDGFCAFEDCDDNDPSLPTAPGTVCDDGNPSTSDDVIQDDGCTCMGEFVAGPCDLAMVVGENSVTFGNLTAAHTKIRVFDASWNLVFECFDDCTDPAIASNLLAGDYLVSVILFNDNWENICESNADINIVGLACDSDADNDGVCTQDDCDDNDPNLPTSPGTSCDDGNGNTINDQIQADGCSCAGVEPNPICDFDYTVDGPAGTISVNNLNAPHIKVRVFDSSWDELFECFDNCTNPQLVGGLIDGDYILNVIYMDESYQLICQTNVNFEISGVNCQVDADNDGYCSDVDCDDNDPNLPLPAGTSCDDGNPLTVNDVILADGCSCAGEAISETPCADVLISTTATSIEVANLDAAHIIIKVYDNFFTNLFFACQDNDCGDPQSIGDLPPGDYVLNIRFFDANWDQTCDVFEVLNVSGPGFGDSADTRDGMNASITDASFSVFPNPVSDRLNIEVSEVFEEALDVLVVDQLGAVVKELRFDAGESLLSMDVAGLGVGVYRVVIVGDGGERVVRKFLKF